MRTVIGTLLSSAVRSQKTMMDFTSPEELSEEELAAQREQARKAKEKKARPITNAFGRGPIDEQIQYTRVRMVDPETKKLGPLVELQRLLIELNGGAKKSKRPYLVELVTEKPEPIVRIVKRSDAWAATKEAKQKRKEKAKAEDVKEIQLTWGTDLHDFEHKLKKVREELESGHKVSMVFAPKKGQPWLNKDGMKVKVDEAVAQLSDVAAEWKPREELRATFIVFLQPKKS
ncbi:hypothetical protein K474DRAFT_1293765 [Panus rudis PR-1116 ss-1]|nr:hypothetical protein K474DRAFT_1293765 [Panus rudis PR-1116 ss-1]